MKIKKLLQLIIGWRILITFFSLIGYYWLPFKDSFPYRDALLTPLGHPLWYSWANFDGVHYLTIAQSGYAAGFTQAFFPLYPVLVKWVNYVFHNYMFSGLFISHVSLAIALYYLYLLIKIDYSKLIANKTILLLLAFPTSFFLGAFYSESLFLMLVVTCLYASRKGMGKEAIILASFATATRIIGVFLIPALLYEKYKQLDSSFGWRNLKDYLPIFLSSSGLIAYMLFLQHKYGDALYFIHAQPAFGAQRQIDGFTLLYQVIFRYFKMFLTVDFNSWLFLSISQEFFLSMLILILLVVAMVKKIRGSYILFALGAYFLPTLTGTFSSMPRYVIVLFPAFLAMAKIIPKRLFPFVVVLSLSLLGLNTILFTRGYWVA